MKNRIRLNNLMKDIVDMFAETETERKILYKKLRAFRKEVVSNIYKNNVLNSNN